MTEAKRQQQLEDGKKYVAKMKEVRDINIVSRTFGVSITVIRNRIHFYRSECGEEYGRLFSGLAVPFEYPVEDPVEQKRGLTRPKRASDPDATDLNEKEAKPDAPVKQKIKLPQQELPEEILVGGSLENLPVEGMMTMSASVIQSTLHVDTGEIRYLVDKYDQLQAQRRATENQLIALSSGADTDVEHEQNIRITASNCALAWIYQQDMNSEKQIKKMLTAWVAAQPMGQYLTSIIGIGPIFASRLMASLKIDGVQSAGQFWSYCGQNDNNVEWLGTSKATEIVNEVWKKYGLEKERTLTLKSIYDYTVNRFNINLYNDAQLEPLTTRETYKQDMRDAATKFSIRFSTKQQKGLELCQDLIDQIDDPTHYDRDDEIIQEFLYQTDLEPLKYQEIQCLSLVRTIAFMAKDALRQFDAEPILGLVLDGIHGELTKAEEGDDMLIAAVLEIAQRTNRKPSTILKGAPVKASKKKDATEEDNVDVGKITKKSMIAYLAKPPYNTSLKSACYLIGKSFVFNTGRGSKYGQLYLDRKMYEIEKNARGDYAEIAAKMLSERNYGKNTTAYKQMSQGKLSDSHIGARSQRWALKIFLSHLFEAMYYERHHKRARHPYIFRHPADAGARANANYIRDGFVDEEHERYIVPEVDYVEFFDSYWRNHPEVTI